MIPLFPKDDEVITIQQGKAGDCYLLASLDCILNGNNEERDLIRSMFTQTDIGVILRIKPSSQSKNLRPEKLIGKYDYYKDPINGDDVFIISNERLEEISKETEDVQSNFLAVKILERISSYYYVGDWDQTPILASVLAHNIGDRHDKTSTQFVGNLLSFHAQDYSWNTFPSLVKLKKLDPKQSIYISLAYGEVDIYGNIHGRHAFRLKNITQAGSDLYKLELANPWDNRATETLYLTSAELNTRKARFSIYSKDEQEHQLKMMLSACSEEHGQYAFNNRDLYNELLNMKKSQGGLNQQVLHTQIMKHMKQKNGIEYHKQLLLENPYDKESAVQLFSFIKKNNIEVDVELMRTFVIEPAICVNGKRLGETSVSAREKIYLGLVAYFFSGNKERLTRSMQLRSYFIEELFSREQIAQIFQKNEFIALTLVNCIHNNLLLDAGARLVTYVRAIKDSEVDENLIKLFLSYCDTEHVAEFFNGLMALHFINPKLVEKSLEFIIKHISSTHGSAYTQFLIGLIQEAPSEFKRWFMQIQKPKVKGALEALTKEILKPIVDFKIDFTSLNTMDEIEQRKQQLISQLNELAEKPKMVGALNTLGLLNSNFTDIISRKETEITTRAQSRVSELKSNCLAALKSINFTSRLATIEQMKNRLNNEAKAKPKYAKAADAAKTLHEALTEAYKELLEGKKTLTHFKQSCLSAIEIAMPTLKEHRGWKNILESIVQAIASLAQIFGVDATNKRWGMFEVKTESRKVTEGLKNELDNFKPMGG